MIVDDCFSSLSLLDFTMNGVTRNDDGQQQQGSVM